MRPSAASASAVPGAPAARGGPTQAAPARRGPVGLTLDPLRVSLIVLTILTISKVNSLFPVLAALRPALVAVVAALLFAALNPRSMASGSILKTWPAKAIAAFGILACLSVPFGISMGNSGKFIIDIYWKVMLYGFLLVVSVRNVKDLHTVIWAYVIGAGILVWEVIFVAEMTVEGSGHLARAEGLGMYDANDIGPVLEIALPLCLLTFSSSGRIGKFFSALIGIGIAISIAKSGSRGAFLGFLATGAALLLLAKGVSVGKRMAFLVVTILALSFAAPEGYWKQMQTITNPTQDYNWNVDYGRKALALRGLSYMMQYPFFGIGIANFGFAECSISPLAVNPGRGGFRCKPPHNSLIEAGACLGIGGFLLWIGLLAGGVVAMLRLSRRLPRVWRRGDPEQRFLYACTRYLPVALIAFAVSSSFVSFAWMDFIYILAALMAGLYTSVAKKLEEEGGAMAPPPARPTRGFRPATGNTMGPGLVIGQNPAT